MVQGIGGNQGFAHRQLATLQNDSQRLSGQLGSGKRLTSAAVDAAGLSISERLSALRASLDQGVRNLNDGVSAVQVAEGGLQSISDDLVRLRELSVQARNGTLNTTDRASLQNEADQIVARLDQTAGSTSFNGTSLLDGSASGSGAITLADGTEGEQISIEFADAGSAALGVSAVQLDQPNSLEAIDSAIDSVSEFRSELASKSNQLNSSISNLRNTSENVAAAESRITDTDIAAAAAEQTRNRILAEGQLAILGQANAQLGATSTRLA